MKAEIKRKVLCEVCSKHFEEIVTMLCQDCLDSDNKHGCGYEKEGSYKCGLVLCWDCLK